MKSLIGLSFITAGFLISVISAKPGMPVIITAVTGMVLMIALLIFVALKIRRKQ